MCDEFRLEFDGTIFSFRVTDKGYDDCGYFWTDAVLQVSNWCINYRTTPSFLEYSELVMMESKLRKLQSDELTAVETLEFIEPDIRIVLKPKHDIRDCGEYSYVIPGYEFEDIKAEFMLFPFMDGVLTEQFYLIPLYRAGISRLTDYLSTVIRQL